MIGVVGSADSVGHVVRMAEKMDLAEGLIARVYNRPEEASDLAAEIDPACNIILFTGRVPYALTVARTRLTATPQYIPHSGVDLYRTLVLLAREHGGVIPRLSIDTLDEQVVRENFEEVGLVAPRHVYALGDLAAGDAARAEAMVAFHREQFDRGNTDLAVTCIAWVREQLEHEQIPAVRVRHTDSSVRDSLNRATLTSQLERSEASQVAVLAAPGGDGDFSADVWEHFETLARIVDGRMMSGAGSTTILTTRGSLERELNRGQVRRILAELSAAQSWIGVGLGHSLPHAEENAKYALTVAAVTQDHHEVLPDESIRRLSDSTTAKLRLRNTDSRLMAAARLGGIGPTTFSRLQAALAKLGREDMTAKELARAYGVEPRSARRLLVALQKAGIARPLGSQAPPGAGRPQVVYKIDLELLFDPDSASAAGAADVTTRGA